MYFFHHLDNGNVTLDLSQIVSFTSSFSLGKTCLRIGSGDLNFIDTKSTIPAIFKCGTCGKHVEIPQIRGRCNNCGKVFTLNELLKPEGSSGVYCGKCLEELGELHYDIGNKFTKVSEMFGKVSMRR